MHDLGHRAEIDIRWLRRRGRGRRARRDRRVNRQASFQYRASIPAYRSLCEA